MRGLYEQGAFASQEPIVPSLPPRTILLTGATGFVGRQIHKALVRQGHRVRAVVRTGTAGRLGHEAQVIEAPDLFAKDAAFWGQAAQGVDAVIHAAWVATPGQYLTSPHNLECVRGTLALAHGSAAARVPHVIGIGTCFEYALPGEHLTVDAPVGPATLYATAKLATFQLLEAFFAGSGTTFSWARLFYLYGEGEHSDRLVAHIKAKLAAGEVARLSAGTQVRDFLDVEVAGAMVARIVESRQPGAINVCSGVPVTVRQLAERTADALGRRDLLEFGSAPPRPGDPTAVVGVCNLTPELC
ncbi:NAD-dependent epimerase/dehydratase family protein [Aquabacter sp. P-9]|uniref:NAD-dependent epimerase/dehydratase family protein n=1 Tax=Aquabacter sediminis TaxID=3029197 RepID=UPI00237DC953|nr:NAD(P)-dependent oxidoreductase [Aquabacter sp. P-9]MDE1570646.1 NAD(P)-dependent oxidoreductase [Aquabacter sp. P-9]